MIRHITEVRSGNVKALNTLGAVASVNHRLRGRRAPVREKMLPVVGLGGVSHEDPVLKEFEPSGNEEIDFAPGAV